MRAKIINIFSIIMCGIFAIVNKTNLSTKFLSAANQIVAHRGPDDEGYLLWKEGKQWTAYSGEGSSTKSIKHFDHPQLPTNETKWTVGLGHRRLSILDLSPLGHQPMTLEDRWAITYNGEVYNYLEIRQTLQKLGHRFNSASDTEVILHAWKEWGIDCLQQFNGMFSFIIIDIQEKRLFAVRDRFGVKPLYYSNNEGYFALASEIKQLRTLPSYQFSLNEITAYEYLRYSIVDHNSNTFENGISQILPGHFLELNLNNQIFNIKKWYELKPTTFKGNEIEAYEQFRYLLNDSIKLRLRSDVPIGSALSGGLDSSTIVCVMREILDEFEKGGKKIETVTSCNSDIRFDETIYAQAIIDYTESKSHKVYPSFEKLKNDLSRMIWHLDSPFVSTSQFSQWCVFEKASSAGLTVMLDGQGADEQLAGYGGNDISLYIGLLRQQKLIELGKELLAFRQYRGKWPIKFLIGAIQYHIPEFLINKLPDRFRVFKQQPPSWLNVPNQSQHLKWPSSLRSSLYRQITVTPLPSLLRYEDRNSMAFSIESRVPFMDYRLIEFTHGLPESLIYKKGERKYILRQAFKGIVPQKILDRRDKMGFVSAEEKWLKEEGKLWFSRMIDESQEPIGKYINRQKASEMLTRIQTGTAAFNSDPWRIICLTQWIKQIQKGWTPTN